MKKFVNVGMAIDVVSKLRSNEVLMDLVNTSFSDEVINELVKAKLIETVYVKITKDEYHTNKKLANNKTKNKRYQCVARRFSDGFYNGYSYYRIDYKLTSRQIANRFKQQLEQEA